MEWAYATEVAAWVVAVSAAIAWPSVGSAAADSELDATPLSWNESLVSSAAAAGAPGRPSAETCGGPWIVSLPVPPPEVPAEAVGSSPACVSGGSNDPLSGASDSSRESAPGVESASEETAATG